MTFKIVLQGSPTQLVVIRPIGGSPADTLHGTHIWKAENWLHSTTSNPFHLKANIEWPTENPRRNQINTKTKTSLLVFVYYGYSLRMDMVHSEMPPSLNAPASSTGMTISVVVAKLKAFRVEHRLFSPKLSTNTSSWVRTCSIQKPWNGWCLERW